MRTDVLEHQYNIEKNEETGKYKITKEIENNTRWKIINQTISNLWLVYFVALILFSFMVYGIEILFSLEHKEYFFDGIYLLGIIFLFVRHSYKNIESAFQKFYDKYEVS